MQTTMTQIGAMISPADPSDLIYEHVAHSPNGFGGIPFSYDYRAILRDSGVGRPKDQGCRGTCAAFSGALIREIQCYVGGGPAEILSPEFIYYHRENSSGDGMYGRNVFQILQKIGIPREKSFPYRDEEPPTIGPSLQTYSEAAKKRITDYVRVTTSDGLKRAIYQYGPCYILLPMYQSRPNFWIPSAAECSEGAHAVTAIGYNAEGFILQNSWGPDWNGDGSILLPYSDWSSVLECWASSTKYRSESGSRKKSIPKIARERRHSLPR